jgi:hypothetical protein
LVALGLAASAAGVGRADSITAPTSALIAYETSGTIGTTGVTGDPTAVTFTPLIGASFMSPSTLDLGQFQAKALAAGQTVTYDNTPFDIKFKVDNVNNATGAVTPNQTPIDIKGVLNGTLIGPNQSSVKATFDAPGASVASSTDPTAYSFLTGLYTNTLKLSDNPQSIVPSSTFGGVSTTQAVLNTVLTPASPAPEPSTVVVFAVAIAGLGLRHRVRLRRS